MNVFARLLEAVEAEGAAALISVTETDGSAPREAGTQMVVRPSGGFNGTIGGGALEWEALALAHQALKAGRGSATRRLQHLGPDLGQCCGGRVALRIESFDPRDLGSLRELARRVDDGPLTLLLEQTPEGRVIRSPAPPDLHRSASVAGTQLEQHGETATNLLLFGAGHVGRALVLTLAPLPFRIRWIDGRPGAFPGVMPGTVTPVASEHGLAELAAAPAGSFVLVMTHSHAIDLDLVTAALRDGKFHYVGLIGSATKRARFNHRMRECGLTAPQIERLVCPIGVSGITDKAPAAIAVATAAQLLKYREITP